MEILPVRGVIFDLSDKQQGLENVPDYKKDLWGHMVRVKRQAVLLRADLG